MPQFIKPRLFEILEAAAEIYDRYEATRLGSTLNLRYSKANKLKNIIQSFTTPKPEIKKINAAIAAVVTTKPAEVASQTDTVTATTEPLQTPNVDNVVATAATNTELDKVIEAIATEPGMKVDVAALEKSVDTSAKQSDAIVAIEKDAIAAAANPETTTQTTQTPPSISDTVPVVAMKVADVASGAAPLDTTTPVSAQTVTPETTPQSTTAATPIVTSALPVIDPLIDIYEDAVADEILRVLKDDKDIHNVHCVAMKNLSNILILCASNVVEQGHYGYQSIEVLQKQISALADDFRTHFEFTGQTVAFYAGVTNSQFMQNVRNFIDERAVKEMEAIKEQNEELEDAQEAARLAEIARQAAATKLKEANKEADGLRGQVKTNGNVNSTNKKKLNEAEAKIHKFEKDATAAQQKITQLTEANNKATAETTRFRDLNSKLVADLNAKTFDLGKATSLVDKLTIEVKQLNDTLATTKKTAAEELANAQKIATDKVTSAEQSVLTMTTTLTNANQKTATYQAGNTTLKKANADLTTRLADSTALTTKLAQERDNIREIAVASEIENTALKTANDKLTTDLANTKPIIAYITTERDQTLLQTTSLKNTNDSLAAEIANLKAQLANSAASIETLTKDRDEARQADPALIAANASLMLDLEVARKQMAAGFRDANESVTNQLLTMTATIDTLTKERDAARQATTAAEAAIASLESTKQSLQTELAKVKVEFPPLAPASTSPTNSPTSFHFKGSPLVNLNLSAQTNKTKIPANNTSPTAPTHTIQQNRPA